MQVIIEGLSVPIKLDHSPLLPYFSLKSVVKTTHQLDLDEFSVYLSGRLLSDESMILDLDRPHAEHLVLRVQSRVLGGKGGFGSQLKAIGAQIHKTTSREACRDLSGRRVRDINAEKRYQQLAREEKRRIEERKLQQVKRREKRWAQRTTRPKLEDPLYYQSLEKNENRVTAALKHAQQMNGKRVSNNQGATSTKRIVFRGMGDLTDSESDSETGVSCNKPPVSSVSIHTDLPLCTADNISEHIQPVPTSSYSVTVLPNDGPIICNEVISSFQTEAIPIETPLPDPIDPNTPLPDPIDPNTPLPDPIDLNTPLPDPIDPNTPLPDPIDLNTPLPDPIDLNTPLPDPMDPNTPLPDPIDLNTPLPDPIDLNTPLPDPIDLNTPLPDPIDLNSISRKQELEKCSLEILKITLLSFGLKCGGTLQERVDRLYTYKVTPRDQLHPSIFAGKGKSRKLDKR
ncbi:Protein SDE2-like [Oopsacas minuta]|uniref:Protein SDE2-like n=1 Tax=Oopsacas minuta TaxID=111878 RepID=A0AAV7JRR5_9METZ|nr:Protein SDE2-like [Oopsacas minuta]